MRHTNPLDRCSTGETIDHDVFIVVFDPLAGDGVGTPNGGSVLATVLVKFGPGGGLNGKHHALSLNERIIAPTRRAMPMYVDSRGPVPATGRYGME